MGEAVEQARKGAHEELEGRMGVIVRELMERGDFNRVIYRFRFSDNADRDEELRKDFRQELALILWQYPDRAKLVRMYGRDRNELMRFMMQIVKKNVCSRTSPYWKKYGRWEFNRSPFNEVF